MDRHRFTDRVSLGILFEMKTETKHTIGQTYEELAVSYLRLQGYEIVEQNFRYRQGEIDIIAKEKETYVFCEVKYRTTEEGGYPEESVSVGKQRRICACALYYLQKKGLWDVPCRFDVISILGEELTHYRNAFSYGE